MDFFWNNPILNISLLKDLARFNGEGPVNSTWVPLLHALLRTTIFFYNLKNYKSDVISSSLQYKKYHVMTMTMKQSNKKRLAIQTFT